MKFCQLSTPCKNWAFFSAFEKTMNKFFPEPPKTDMVRYIAGDPIKPEIEVYENMAVHTGLPEALLGS